MLRLCIGNSKIPTSIKRYPVIPHGPVWYVLMLFYIAFYVVSNFIIITSCREMFHSSSGMMTPGSFFQWQQQNLETCLYRMCAQVLLQGKEFVNIVYVN